jgi:hypothetical protein
MCLMVIHCRFVHNPGCSTLSLSRMDILPTAALQSQGDPNESSQVGFVAPNIPPVNWRRLMPVWPLGPSTATRIAGLALTRRRALRGAHADHLRSPSFVRNLTRAEPHARGSPRRRGLPLAVSPVHGALTGVPVCHSEPLARSPSPAVPSQPFARCPLAGLPLAVPPLAVPSPLDQSLTRGFSPASTGVAQSRPLSDGSRSQPPY